jgi:arylsulfatase A-like enzyme
VVQSLLIVVFTACDSVAPGPPAPETSFLEFKVHGPRNLLMLSIDTLRKDHVGRYGDLGLTPFLDGLMAQGVPLDDHRSCSNWTYPSAICVFGGRTNTDMAFIPPLNKARRKSLPDGHQQLPVWLRDDGWRTGLASSNAYLGPEYSTDQGYEEFKGGTFHPGGEMVGMGLDMLDSLRWSGDSWYLHIHFRDAHVPYDPPHEYLEGLDELPELAWDLTDRDETYEVMRQWPDLSEEDQALLKAHLELRYRGTVRYTDDTLKGLFEGLDASGVLDDTLVVVWSDHGEQFWEHGLHTHAYTMHYAENDALAFFWAKDLAPGVWSEPTSHIDLAPTILEAMGLPIPVEVTGEPVGQARANRAIHTVSDARLGIMMSLQVGDAKLQYRWKYGEKEFYRRADDPFEENDLYDSTDPEIIALWIELDKEIERLIPLVPEDKIPEDRGP